MISAKILETLMLICFGAAWPASIYKSWRSRTAKGKSISFLFILLVGYVIGIGKVILTDGIGGFLLIPYAINLCMVSCDIGLYFRNRQLDHAETGRDSRFNALISSH